MMESINKDVEDPPHVANGTVEGLPEQTPSMEIEKKDDEETASQPSQATEDTLKPEQVAEQEMTGGEKSTKMWIVVTATILLLVLAAILIGVLVPTKKTKTDKSMMESMPQFYESSDGPFHVKVPYFDPAIFDVYESVDEATLGFELMAKVLLNNVINRFLGVPGYENAGQGTGQGTSSSGTGGATVDLANDAASTVTSDTSAKGKIVGDDVDAWETNNQDDLMDRSDITKSDGKYVYAAYEDTVWVLRANQAQNGQKQLVTQLKLPPIPIEDSEPCYFTTTCNEEGECTTCDCKGKCKVHVANPNSGSTLDEADSIASSISSTESYYADPWYAQKPTVQSMLLGENRLLLVVSGYGYAQQARIAPTCVNDYLSTQIRLYSTENLGTTGELELIGIQDVHGSFQEAYLIENVMHMVSMASVNTYDYLVSPMNRYSTKYSGMNDTDYEAAVNEASGSVIENFTTCLVDELSMITGSFPTVAKLGIMADGSPGDVSPGIMMPEGYGSSIAQITSLNLVNYTLIADGSEEDAPRLQVEQTIQIMDSWLGSSLSAENMIVISGQGNHWNANGGSTTQTYLFAFLLHDVYSVPLASGTIPGSLLNEYALYYENGYFRAATTSRIDIYESVYGTPVDWLAVWDSTQNTTFADDHVYIEEDDQFDQGGVIGTVNFTARPEGRARRLQQVALEDNVSHNNSIPLSPTNDTDKPTLSRLISSCTEMDDCPNQAQTCQGYMDLGCSQVFYSPESCNIYCWDRYEDLVTRSGCPTPGDPCLGEDDFLKCVQTVLNPYCGNFNLQSDVCPYAFEFPCDSATSYSTYYPSYAYTHISPCLRLPKTSSCDHDQQETTCLSLEDGGCTDIRVFDDCRIECFTPPDSLTENYVYSLFPNENKKLEVTGKVNIGLDNEQIFAVRFFKHFAYAVTHEYTDPLYAISFADPAVPTVIGEVKTTGFSSYLHSINLNDTMLLGFGKESDENGNPFGLKFFMFDATDAADPKLVTSYVLNDASSTVEYEEKSFRYVSLFEGEGMGKGVLILPLYSWSNSDDYGNNNHNNNNNNDDGTHLDGFRVFTVSFNNAAGSGSIEPLYDFSHTDYCYNYCPSFEARSFVVNGDLITIKSSSVRSHDLENGSLKWMVNF